MYFFHCKWLVCWISGRTSAGKFWNFRRNFAGQKIKGWEIRKTASLTKFLNGWNFEVIFQRRISKSNFQVIFLSHIPKANFQVIFRSHISKSYFQVIFPRDDPSFWWNKDDPIDRKYWRCALIDRIFENTRGLLQVYTASFSDQCAATFASRGQSGRYGRECRPDLTEISKSD